MARLQLALAALALSATLPVCSSSILQAPLGARLEGGAAAGDTSLPSGFEIVMLQPVY